MKKLVNVKITGFLKKTSFAFNEVDTLRFFLKTSIYF